MSFRDLELKGFYSAVDDRLNGFYVPLLKQARTYDRVSGYFSSRTLVAAAAGLSHFIVNGGTMRLIVGVRLHEDDIDAILHGEGLDEVLARRLTTDPLEATDIVGRHRLETIGYLVKHGRLQIRVGVPMEGGRLLSPRETDAYFHSKYGIFADREGNRVAFVGSDNETRQGWEEHHETFTVAKSWLQEVWSEIGRRAVEDFEAHWQDRAGPNWRIMPLPAAVEQRLIDRAPAEAPPPPDPAEGEQSIAVTDLALREVVEAPAKDGGTGVGFATSVIDPWPHQIAIARRVVDTFPRSYLFADEVGLGKTIEAGLVLRELMLSGRAKTGLLLVPASLLRQWQEELYEKFGLRVPRLTGSGFLDVYTDEELPSPGNPWSAYPLVLASSHLARRKDRREQVLSAGPWDVVLVDEAHHARRRGSKPTDTPNALLSLLMTMKATGAWRGPLPCVRDAHADASSRSLGPAAASWPARDMGRERSAIRVLLFGAP